MAKHLWTIVNLENGEVQGTNNTDLIDDMVDDDRFVIIHAEGSYFRGDRTENDIETIIEEDDDDFEDEDEVEDEDEDSQNS